MNCILSDKMKFSVRLRRAGAKGVSQSCFTKVMSGVIHGTQASGCATTSDFNTLRQISYHNLVGWAFPELSFSAFCGGDDCLGICEAADAELLQAAYLKYYSFGANSVVGLGLTMDSFRTDACEASFLSMRVVRQGAAVVVSKMPRRFAVYGSSWLPQPVGEDFYLKQVAMCVAAVIPNDPAYSNFSRLDKRPKPHHIGATTRDDFGLGIHSGARIRLEVGGPEGLLVLGGGVESAGQEFKTLPNYLFSFLFNMLNLAKPDKVPDAGKARAPPAGVPLKRNRGAPPKELARYVQRYKQINEIPKLSPLEMSEAYKNESANHHDAIVKLMNHLALSSNRTLTSAIGLKFAS